MTKVDKSMIIADILRMDQGQGIAAILMECGMHCLGCPSSQMESLADACAVHNIDPDMVEQKINAYLDQK